MAKADDLESSLEKDLNLIFRSRKRDYLEPVLLLAVLSIIDLGTMLWLDTTNISGQKIVQASQMTLQFDSFLAGGWTVGFFYFYGAMVKELRELRQLGYRLKRLKTTTSNSVKGYINAASWEKLLSRAPSTVLMVAGTGILFYVASGLLAVAASITENASYLIWAIVLLVNAVGMMLLTWLGLQHNLNAFSTFQDKYGVLLRDNRKEG